MHDQESHAIRVNAVLALLLACMLTTVGACGRPAPDRPVGPVVTIVLDGRAVRSVTAADIGKRMSLADVLPGPARDQATWVMLDVRAREERRSVRWPHPATRYPDQDACLYVDEEGRPSFGIYRRDTPDLHPRLRELLDVPAPFVVDVVRIHVRTQETPAEQASRERFGTLTVVVDGGEAARLTSADLDGLEALEAPPPGEGITSRPGRWHLRTVLARLTPSLDPAAIRRIVAIDQADKRHTVDPATVTADVGTVATIRRNRRGDLHLHLLVDGKATTKWRSVHRLEVSTR